MNNNQYLQPNFRPNPTYPNQPIPMPSTSAQQIPISRQPIRQPQAPTPTNMAYRQAQYSRPQMTSTQYINSARPRQVINNPSRPIVAKPTIATPTAPNHNNLTGASVPKTQSTTPIISHVDIDSKHPFNNRTDMSTVIDPIPEPKKPVSSGPAKPKRHIFRKIFVTVLILAILGGIGYGIFFVKVTGDKVANALFNFVKTASNNASVTIKGTIKITSQNDDELPFKENSELLDFAALGDTFSTAKLHFNYSSNVNNLDSELVLNLTSINYDEQASASSLNINITNIDENSSYIKYNSSNEPDNAIKNISSKLASLDLIKNTWVKSNNIVDQNYFSVKSLVDLLQTKNINPGSYQPDFFIFAFPTNRVKKVGNELYQVIIDTMRLKWFFDKYSIAKIDDYNLFDLPEIFVEIDSTGRITRVLLQKQYNYYNVTANIYDISFSSEKLQLEIPTEYVEITEKNN